MKLKLTWLAVMTALCLTLDIGHAQQVASGYTVIDLGIGQACGLNNSNQVVGRALSFTNIDGFPSSYLPTLWNFNGSNVTRVELGYMYNGGGSGPLDGSANSINDNGYVVGNTSALVFADENPDYGYTNYYREPQAFVWTPDTNNGTTGSMVNLTPDLSGYCWDPIWWASTATSINSSNQIVGCTYYYGLYNHGVLCNYTNGIYRTRIYGFANDDYAQSVPKGINNNGVITGWGEGPDLDAPTDSPYPYYMIFDRGMVATTTSLTLTNLGTFYGPTDTAYTNGSLAYGINNSNQIVGWSPPYTACMWTNGTAASIVPLLPIDSSTNAYALGINDYGTVVGTITSLPGGKAFVYDSSSGFHDLNTLIATNSGWTLIAAQGINNLGYIAGSATTTNTTHAVLLVPSY